MLKPYLNTSVVPLDSIIDTSPEDEPSLLDQAGGRSLLTLAVDEQRLSTAHRLTDKDQAEVVAMYAEGQSIRAIAIKRRMGWHSVVKLLDQAGVERRRAGR